MNVSAWLRFIELCLLAGWLGWRLFRRQTARGLEPLLPALVAGIGAAQLIVAAQSATDALMPLAQVMPGILASAYGGFSLAVIALAAGQAVWQWRSRRTGQDEDLDLQNAVTYPVTSWQPWAPATFLTLALLLCAGVASAGAANTLSAAASSGEIAMSPSLLVPRSATSIANPYANDPASAQRGKVVFQQNCAVCHGLDGDGNGPAGANLRIRPASFRNAQHFLTPGMDGAHFWVIQHGDGRPGGMPAWEGTLTQQQMWDVLNYVKQLSSGMADTTPAAAGADSSREPGIK